MTNKNNQKNRHHTKNYILAFLLGFPLVSGTIILALLFIPKDLPHYATILLYFLLFSPIFIIFIHIIYRMLIPVTGGIPLTKPAQWVLLYTFMVGFGIFWALLSLLFETFAPNLPVEDRQTTLPIITIAVITIILSTTRLRHPIARFFNRLFGTEPEKEKHGATSNA